jgi:hypothetical protein
LYQLKSELGFKSGYIFLFFLVFALFYRCRHLNT